MVPQVSVHAEVLVKRQDVMKRGEAQECKQATRNCVKGKMITITCSRIEKLLLQLDKECSDFAGQDFFAYKERIKGILQGTLSIYYWPLANPSKTLACNHQACV